MGRSEEAPRVCWEKAMVGAAWQPHVLRPAQFKSFALVSPKTINQWHLKPPIPPSQVSPSPGTRTELVVFRAWALSHLPRLLGDAPCGDPSSYLVFIWVSPSSLSNKEPGAFFQLHLIWGALEADTLMLLTVQVEDNFLLLHADGEARPLVEQGGHGEGGSRVGAGRAGLCVVENDLLLARPQLRELDAHIDDALRGVCDGKEHASPGRGGLDVKQQREVPVERARQVVPGHLACIGIGTKDVARVVVGAINSVDLLRRWVPDQLQQADLSTQALCKEKGQGMISTSQARMITQQGQPCLCLPNTLLRSPAPRLVHWPRQ